MRCTKGSRKCYNGKCIVKTTGSKKPRCSRGTRKCADEICHRKNETPTPSPKTPSPKKVAEKTKKRKTKIVELVIEEEMEIIPVKKQRKTKKNRKIKNGQIKVELVPHFLVLVFLCNFIGILSALRRSVHYNFYRITRRMNAQRKSQQRDHQQRWYKNKNSF